MADAAKTTDGRATRARALRERTRAQLVEAARAAFSAQGYHGASIADILAGAQVARGTFYAHFASKEEAFAAVLGELLDRLTDAIRPVVVEDATSVRRQLIANLERVLTVLNDRADLARLLLVIAPGSGPEVDTPVDRFHDAARAMILRSLSAGAAIGIVDDDNLELQATFIMGVIRETVTRALKTETRLQPKRVAEALLEFVLRGVLRTPASDPLLDLRTDGEAS